MPALYVGQAKGSGLNISMKPDPFVVPAGKFPAKRRAALSVLASRPDRRKPLTICTGTNEHGRRESLANSAGRCGDGVDRCRGLRRLEDDFAHGVEVVLDRSRAVGRCG